MKFLKPNKIQKIFYSIKRENVNIPTKRMHGRSKQRTFDFSTEFDQANIIILWLLQLQTEKKNKIF